MRRGTLLIATLWMAAAATCWGAPRHLSIALYNYANLPPEVLNPAMQMVAETLADVGIRPEWSVCLKGPDLWVEGCTTRFPPAGCYVILNLMWKRNAPVHGPGLGYEVAGMAIQDSARLHGARAFAFYGAVKAIAEKAHRRAAIVLACVLVHEIAHTLGLRHRNQGVMRPILDPRAMDDAMHGLAFDGIQGKQLRKAVEGLALGAEVRP